MTAQARLGASLPEDVTAMLLLADAAGSRPTSCRPPARCGR
ncbi:Uncharacterised protein [Bordetella pertussis]|nr:Uncharacterised protein [Bordetella pertussis]